MGPTGPTGDTGATGSIGITGPLVTTAGVFYRPVPTNVLAANSIIAMQVTGPNTIGDLVLAANGGVRVNTAGLYSVSYMANTENNVNASTITFALNINGGAAIPASRVTTSPFTTRDLGAQPAMNTALVRLTAGDILTMIVTSASANQYFSGPNSASITFVRIGN